MLSKSRALRCVLFRRHEIQFVAQAGTTDQRIAHVDRHRNSAGRSRSDTIAKTGLLPSGSTSMILNSQEQRRCPFHPAPPSSLDARGLVNAPGNVCRGSVNTIANAMLVEEPIGQEEKPSGEPGI